MFDNIFETVNSGFAQLLYEDFVQNPASIPAEWRAFFENGGNGNGGKSAGTIAPRPAVPVADAPAPAPATKPVSGGVTPIKGPALRLLENMEASLDLPTATSFREIDVTHLWNVRASANAVLATRGLKLSFTHLIGWALVRALREFPTLTHAVVMADGAPHRLDPGAFNLGLAVDVERKDGTRGLMVPVIKHADGLSFSEFHTEYERLVTGARDGKLLPDAYQGGTVTLTNPGTLGTSASVPRLMTGQGTIIATGAIRQIAAARIMTITSTYDHRIIQGAESGSFLRRVDGLLQGSDGFYEEIAKSLGIALAGDERRETSSTVAAVAAVASTPAPNPSLVSRPSSPSAPEFTVPSHETLAQVSAAVSLVRAHRTHGHHAARLDPLGVPPEGDPALDPASLGLTPEVMARIPSELLRVYVAGATLAEALPALRDVYCGTMAYEIEHIGDHDERVWLRRVIESGEHRTPLTTDEQKRLLEALTKTDVLERFLHRAYLGHRRFGIEGMDVLVPMLEAAIDLGDRQGAREVVLGCAHRGRLNVLTHILGLPYEMLLAEFEGGRKVEETLTPKGGTGDVKYHHGATGTFTTPSGANVGVTLMPNPSHLEAVDPVVDGRTRAAQTTRDGARSIHDPRSALAIVIHGDAAFAAQGVVAETFNLARLDGYSTGGTLHLILNNQVGFTTDPKEARSTEYASDLAKGFDIPIIHVNADDPEACIAAIRLALMYRQKFGGDSVIDLVGYRRHGHNEGDEPRYTQPLMYQLIDAHPPVRDLYSDRLAVLGVVTREEATRAADQRHRELASIQQKLKEDLTGQTYGEEPDRVSTAIVAALEPRTAVPGPLLQELNTQLLVVPQGFAIHPKLKRQLDRRLNALDGSPSIDWGHAEALAYASLLADGIPLRLTGQDTPRGTFAQRHLVLHDMNTGARYAPIQNLEQARAPFELHNTALSEFAVLGFEYGYSIAVPGTLVLWEAQFGDFANGAQVIIDQFIVAGLSKWGQMSRIVLLLPHGYEGQGPEHSSARLERFLALGAEANIRVANCSTPAQYFHLLRRQARHEEIRPLVIMTPKSLLRLPQAASSLSDLATGRFQPTIDDPMATDKSRVSRLVFCSGKIYYDVTNHPRRTAAPHVALARIEMLYPFPLADVLDILREYPAVEDVVWLQEEPSNLGARKWVVPQLEALVRHDIAVRFVSRPERSSPAEGYPAAHQAEQERLIGEALA